MGLDPHQHLDTRGGIGTRHRGECPAKRNELVHGRRVIPCRASPSPTELCHPSIHLISLPPPRMISRTCFRCGQVEGRCNQTHATLGQDEYIVDASAFDETLYTFLTDELPVSSATVFSSASTNYDAWEEQIRVRNETPRGRGSSLDAGRGGAGLFLPPVSWPT